MTSEKSVSLIIGIVVAIIGSLVAYVFYGFINLSAEVKTMHPVIEQTRTEQKDLWDKYNKNQDQKIVFIKDYYQFKVDVENRWTEFYKEKKLNNEIRR